MRCIACGNNEFFVGAKDVAYVYKGHKTTLKGVSGEHCLHCNEVIMTPAQADEFLAKAAEFDKEVDATIAAPDTQEAEPAYIAKVRSKLDLSQREASEIFGGGVNAFNRYENGKAKAPRSTVKLLRVLDSHPELLNEIRF